MIELHFADEVLARIRAREDRFHERAYLFMLGAIEYLQCRLPERRHVSGQELALACRDLALEQYGLMAGTVLRHWGLTATRDFGSIVYTLVDINLLTTQSGDRVEDFEDVFDFDDVFESQYAWRGVPGVDSCRGSYRLEER